MVAMLLAILLSIGLFELGWKARRWSEHARVATEARSVAKQKLEELIAAGRDGLAKPGCLLANAGTNVSSLGQDIVLSPRILWHAGDKSVVSASSNVYAELHLDVTFVSPLQSGRITNSFSMILN